MSEEKKVKNRERLIALLLLLLEQGRQDMAQTIDRYHSRLYELGVETGAVIGGEGQILTRFEVARNVEAIVEFQVQATLGWMESVAETVSRVMLTKRFTPESFRVEMGKAVRGQAYRATNSTKSSWRTAHLGMRDEIREQDKFIQEFRIEAIFTAFPEAEVIESSCDGCPGAVAGNPYTPETVPTPGDFPCLFNCRHEVWYRKVPVTEP